MGSFTSRHAFDPLDLEIIDTACAYIVPQNLCDPERSPEEEDALRQGIFVLAGNGSFDFDNLSTRCWRIWLSFASPRAPPELSTEVTIGNERLGGLLFRLHRPTVRLSLPLRPIASTASVAALHITILHCKKFLISIVRCIIQRA